MLDRLLNISLDTPIYVVGGAVRDHILQIGTHDYDILLPEQGFMGHLANVSSVLGVQPYALNHEHKLWRYQRGPIVVDVAPFGEKLEENLRQRDFTVNSMAVKLADYLNGDFRELIDPCQGYVDLGRKLLVPSSDMALHDDPVRVLRAARFMGELGFSSSVELHQQSEAAASALRNAPGERIWGELYRIVNSTNAPQLFTWLDSTGALAAILPELEAEKGIEQNQYHSFCVYEHSRRAFVAYLDMWEEASFLANDLRTKVRAELKNMDTRLQAVCRLGSLLHDIGKPKAKAFKDDGRITFYRHEQIGAEMVPHLTQRLRLSGIESKALYRFVRWHTYLAQLARQPRLTEAHLHRVARRLGVYSVPIALFNVADLLAKGEDMSSDKSYEQMVSAVSRFLHAWFYEHNTVIHPVLPINGAELSVQLGIAPGRWLNDVLAYLGEQSALGNLKDKDQAIIMAREYYRRMPK